MIKRKKVINISSEALKRAKKKYKAKLKHLNIDLDPIKDLKIIEVLETKENKKKYIIELIKKDNNLQDDETSEYKNK